MLGSVRKNLGYHPSSYGIYLDAFVRIHACPHR
jgi:hypothetical protein